MRLYEVEQGSDEWRAARCGVITASMFHVCRERVGGLTKQQELYVAACREGKTPGEAQAAAGYKAKPRMTDTLNQALNGEVVGKPSAGAMSYAINIAMERISGEPQEENFNTWQMERGQKLEEDARLVYEDRKGILIEKSGFITTDDGIYGASSDGLDSIANSGIEIKCLLSGQRIKNVLIDNDLSEFVDQVQGNIWIGEMDYMDFVLYVPALKNAGNELTIVRIERDEEYIAALVKDLNLFEELVDQYESILRRSQERGAA